MTSMNTKTPFDLTGRVALVTGGGTGIGAECVRLLAAHGADVVLASRGLENLALVAETVGAATGRKLLPVAADVKEEEACVRLVEQTIGELGRIDILVNNAGGARFGPLVDTPTKAWDAVNDLNVRGPFVLIRESGRHMIAQGSGAIVNIGSGAGVRGQWGGAGYSAAKAALHMLTRVVAAEWGRYGVRCNCVSVSAPVISERVHEAMVNARMDQVKMAAAIPLGRLGVPSDIAWPVLFLASDASAYVSGQTIEVDGGPKIEGSSEAWSAP